MKKCHYCKETNSSQSYKEIKYVDGSIDEEYEIRCDTCGNLLYGYIRRLEL